jgi:hypothetical protein
MLLRKGQQKCLVRRKMELTSSYIPHQDVVWKILLCPVWNQDNLIKREGTVTALEVMMKESEQCIRLSGL